jgi:hypothetical protein
MFPHPSQLMLATGDTTPTARRYTRIRITAAQASSAGVYSVSQLTCHTTVGGSDILAGSGATVTASSTFSGQPVSNVYDASDSTFWASNTTGTQDIVIDWGSGNGKNICEIGIKGRNDTSFFQSPLTMNVSYSSDNSTYTSDWDIPLIALKMSGTGTLLSLQKFRRTSLFPSTSPNRRLWGIRATAASASPIELAKVELRATVGGATICTGGDALGSASFDNSFIPTVAFDGSTGQYPWAATSGKYLIYDFGEGNEKAKPAQIAIKASSIPSRCPTGFDLIYQDGLGGAVTVQQSFTTAATWTSGEVRTFTVT